MSSVKTSAVQLSRGQETFKDKASTEKWIRSLAKKLKRPSIVCLNGGMGAGKTQITRWLSEALGAESATSPTFALNHRYDAKGAAIEHWDLYRLESDEDLESTGFWDLLKSDDLIMIVEWSDRLPDDVWPKQWQKVSLQVSLIGASGGSGESESREIKWSIKG